MLVVSDPEKSRDWYVKVLDATVHSEYGSSVVLKLQDTWLLLVEGAGPTPDKPTITLTEPDDPNHASSQIIFRVDDCQETYRLLTSRGAGFLTSPRHRGSETRAFFQDPDNHLFEISEVS